MKPFLVTKLVRPEMKEFAMSGVKLGQIVNGVPDIPERARVEALGEDWAVLRGDSGAAHFFSTPDTTTLLAYIEDD